MTIVHSVSGRDNPGDVDSHRLALPLLHQLLPSEVAEYRFLDELRTSELHDLCVRFEPAVDRHADLPRTGEHFRIFDRGLVTERITADRRVPFDHVEGIAVKVPGPVEP